MTDVWTGPAYDTRSDPQHEWRVGVLDRLGMPPGAVVLDAGCGSGRVTAELVRRFPSISVTAVDRSDSMLRQARTRLAPEGDRVRFRRVDLEAGLPFPNGFFDVVLSTGVLHRIRDHGALFAEVARVLRPGGTFAAQCGGAGSLAEVRAILADLGVGTSARNRYATAEDTADLLRRAGFADVRTWLSDAPVGFDTADDLADFLTHAAAGPWLAGMAEDLRASVLRTVAGRLRSPRLDFVRSNLSAALPGGEV